VTFFDNLFNRNPTRDWQPQRGLKLVLDLEQETLCGIGFGEVANRLAKLGPAEDARAARAGHYRYPSRGFSITTELGRVVEFELTYYPDACYTGEVTLAGRALPLSQSTTQADLMAALGPPAERLTDGEPPDQTVLLRYEKARGTWEFSVDETGRLEYVWGGKRD
jgi:hypothetical protein